MDASAFTDLSTKQFFNYKNTSCFAKVVRSTKFGTYYVGINKQSVYFKDNEEKHSDNNLLLSIWAAKQLLAILPEVIATAEQIQLKESSGVHHSHIVEYKVELLLYYVSLMHIESKGSDAADGRFSDFVEVVSTGAKHVGHLLAGLTTGAVGAGFERADDGGFAAAPTPTFQRRRPNVRFDDDDDDNDDGQTDPLRSSGHVAKRKYAVKAPSTTTFVGKRGRPVGEAMPGKTRRAPRGRNGPIPQAVDATDAGAAAESDDE